MTDLTYHEAATAQREGRLRVRIDGVVLPVAGVYRTEDHSGVEVSIGGESVFLDLKAGDEVYAEDK
jgi:hypothetical protein